MRAMAETISTPVKRMRDLPMPRPLCGWRGWVGGWVWGSRGRRGRRTRGRRRSPPCPVAERARAAWRCGFLFSCVGTVGTRRASAPCFVGVCRLVGWNTERSELRDAAMGERRSLLPSLPVAARGLGFTRGLLLAAGGRGAPGGVCGTSVSGVWSRVAACGWGWAPGKRGDWASMRHAGLDASSIGGYVVLWGGRVVCSRKAHTQAHEGMVPWTVGGAQRVPVACML